MTSPLSRRHFLYGAGVSMLLPRLESFGADPTAELPKRFLGLYVGHGFAIPRKDDDPARDWSFYPRVANGKMTFCKPLASLQPLADQASVFYGLDHPQLVGANGHSSADSFLTGANPAGGAASPSLDQVAAMAFGKKTRFPSLVLANEAGLGISGGSLTLSYERSGRPIPSVGDLPALYNQLFNSDPKLAREEKDRYARTGDLVDRVRESANDLKRQASIADNRLIDSYLDSVRSVETTIETMKKWADTPKPKVATNELSLKATVSEPQLFIETMYQLVYLAFLTDSTRYATYMLQSMGDGPWTDMPKNALGLGANHHLLAHNAAGGGAKAVETLGAYDKFHGDLLGKFLKRLAEAPEGDGTMLDRTLVLYGCSNSVTHVNKNYPLLLVGGRKLGVKQGQFLDFEKSKVPLSNLYLTLLHQLGVRAATFSDSTGTVKEIFS